MVVTASHNPPEYNGYKVYWQNAAQIIPPVDEHIAAAIAGAPSARDSRKATSRRYAPGTHRGCAREHRGGLPRCCARPLHPPVAATESLHRYTPMHGVGRTLVHAALSEGGFADVTSVPEQQRPDGAFPTVAFPNPEEKGAMDSRSPAHERRAPLVLANDPDADRLAVRRPQGRGFRQLTGNQVGVLLGHYLLTERTATAEPRVVLASIVSSPLLGRIAASLGVRYEETLTGFKWIANRAMRARARGLRVRLRRTRRRSATASGSVVRDKDGISAALLAAEVTRCCASGVERCRTSSTRSPSRWGVFTSTQVNVTRKGAAGVAAIRAMMDHRRAAPPARRRRRGRRRFRL